MRKVIYPVAVFISCFFFFSCNENRGETNEYYDIQHEVHVLSIRVDSLIAAINEKSNGETLTKKRPSKPKKTIYPISAPTNYAPNSRKTVSSQYSYSGQCQAITKKGYRCSRRARSNGYCWQHGG